MSKRVFTFGPVFVRVAVISFTITDWLIQRLPLTDEGTEPMFDLVPPLVPGGLDISQSGSASGWPAPVAMSSRGEDSTGCLLPHRLRSRVAAPADSVDATSTIDGSSRRQTPLCRGRFPHSPSSRCCPGRRPRTESPALASGDCTGERSHSSDIVHGSLALSPV